MPGVSRFTAAEDTVIRVSFPTVKLGGMVALLPGHTPDQIAARAKYLCIRKLPYCRGRGVLHTDLPPSPFVALSEREQGYIAGLIDGEGSIQLEPSNGDSGTYRATIMVSNCHLPVLTWLAARLGGKVVPLRAVERKRQAWEWQLHGNPAVIALARDLAPYLIIKREQAEVVGAGWNHLPIEERLERWRRVRAAKHVVYPHSISG